jgi:hypothetical protein
MTLLHGLVLTNNTSQGGKNRRREKSENDDDKRELVFREDGQVYAQVTKMLGNEMGTWRLCASMARSG